MSDMELDSMEIMLDDPAMDMVDGEIEDIEDAEASLESCLEDADMALVDKMADALEGTPGYILGRDILTDVDDEKDPYEGIKLF